MCFTQSLYDCCSSGSSWLKVTPFGFRRLLNYFKDTFNNVPVYVTENGITDNNGTVNDGHRISYYSQYINELMKGNVLTVCIHHSCSLKFSTRPASLWN